MMIDAPDYCMFGVTGRPGMHKHLVRMDDVVDLWTHKALCGVRVKHTAVRVVDDGAFCRKCQHRQELIAKNATS